MLNQYLIKNQPQHAHEQRLDAAVRDTRIHSENAANACRERVRKETFQRMNRRHNRAIFAANRPTGWVARLW